MLAGQISPSAQWFFGPSYAFLEGKQSISGPAPKNRGQAGRKKSLPKRNGFIAVCPTLPHGTYTLRAGDVLVIRSSPGPEPAARLFMATLAATMVGIFLGIFLLFVNPAQAVTVALVVLVGVVGILSFFRHTIFYRSDQARMGWSQDHPQFQMEVGYANLAIGAMALATAVFSWGMTAAAVCFFTYGLYLLGALAVHVRDLRMDRTLKKKKMPSIVNTAIFVVFLFLFGTVALMQG